jgi:DNA-binding transcriptional LysR family regulator
MDRAAVTGAQDPSAPNPDDIALLIRSVELGSLSAAARERDAPVSQVSRAITRLERALGARLLRRSTHGLSLTHEGAAVIAHGREILARLQDLQGLVARGRQKVSGPVRLATSPAIADDLVVPGLAGLLAKHPELRMEVVAEDRIVDLPTEGIDVALRSTVGSSDGVVARRIGGFQRAIFASPAYLAGRGTPTTPQDLPRHRIVTHTAATTLNHWRFRVDGRTVDVAVTGHLSANSTWLMQRMAIAGAGLVRLSTVLAAAAVARGELVEVLPKLRDPTRQDVYAVTLPDRQRLPRIQAVLDYLARAARGRWGDAD